MSHSFFNSLARSKYLSFFSPSFSFTLRSTITAKSTIQQITPLEFFTPVFHWGLSNSKSSQVSRTLLNIPASFNNAVIWLVLIIPLISSSSSFFSWSFGTVQKHFQIFGKFQVFIIIVIIFIAVSLAQWLVCSPMAWETRVQSQVKSYQRLKKWYLMPPCLTLKNVSTVKWSNPGK